MGFWEAISKIIPESLIKIDQRKTFFIKGENIVYNGNIIKDSQKNNEIFSEMEKFQKEESLPFQLIHEDLITEYKEYELIHKTKSTSLILLKEILPIEEIECILMARRIKIAFEKKDELLAKELVEQLDKHYPKKGRKVANLIKPNYFDELIIPMIDICKIQHGQNYKEKFREFYEGILKFFPLAIFVNNDTTEEIIEEEIKKRLKLKRIPLIKIHSIGKANIEKVEGALDKIKNLGKFNIRNNKFTTSTGVEAQNIELIIEKNYI